MPLGFVCRVVSRDLQLPGVCGCSAKRLRKLWLEISEKEPGAEIRHRDVVSVALSRFDKEFHSDQGIKILNEIRREALEQKNGMKSGSEQSED
jgi:hypothetical protein